MENYGRKNIDYIFGKRSNSSAVSYEREQKIQANSDRSDIRVFETGISPQRHGNIRQSSRAAEEEMSDPKCGLCKKVTENMNYLRNFLHFHLICFESISLQTIPY